MDRGRSGEVELVDGKAEVAIDPLLAAIADVESYQVFLSPYAPVHAYVNRRDAGSFQIRVAGAKKGAKPVACGWRLGEPAAAMSPPSASRPTSPPPPARCRKPTGRRCAGSISAYPRWRRTRGSTLRRRGGGPGRARAIFEPLTEHTEMGATGLEPVTFRA